jgi:hypothetical protein
MKMVKKNLRIFFLHAANEKAQHALKMAQVFFSFEFGEVRDFAVYFAVSNVFPSSSPRCSQ